MAIALKVWILSLCILFAESHMRLKLSQDLGDHIVTDQKITVPFKYPLFKQCNSTWANNIMVNTTICDVGCLMSSVSMALNGKGFKINGKAPNPGNYKDNSGYVGDNELDEEAVTKLDPKNIKYLGPFYGNQSFSPAKLKKMLRDAVVVIANVRQGTHFVLVIGFDDGDTNWYVNDPGFSNQYYTYDEIVGYRLFAMQTPN